MIDFEERIQAGRQYFIALARVFETTWTKAYDTYAAEGRPVTLALALLHPAWLEGESMGHRDLRGPRAFASSASTGGCQADLLWGYECAGRVLETDHMFPYALGGPTRADNALILCRDHNRLKGHDVHLIPWNSYQFPWVGEQLNAMKSRQELLLEDSN